MRSSRNSRKTELIEDVSAVVVTRKRKTRSPAEFTSTSSTAASSTRASGSPLEENFEEGPPCKRQAPNPPAADPEGDASAENNAASGESQLKLPSVANMLPDDLFERFLTERQPSPPPGTDPYLFLTTGNVNACRVASMDSSPTRLHSPQTIECPEAVNVVASTTPVEDERSPQTTVTEIRGAARDERIIPARTSEVTVTPLPHDYPMVPPVYWHPPGADMWGRPSGRSPSPGRRHSYVQQEPEAPVHGPKTRKAWTNFEREVIREYCLWLLKTPEYEGESVLPPDPEIWEDIKDALWDMYPGRFQRSRQGIMELARKMNLRRGTREELSKRQTRPKDQLLKSGPNHHLMKTRESATSNACGESTVTESQ